MEPVRSVRRRFGVPRMWKPTLAVVVCAAVVLGCEGVTHPPSVAPGVGVLAADMQTFTGENMKLKLPPGWVAVAPGETLPPALELPRRPPNESGVLAFRKSDRGSIVVWCSPPGQYDRQVRQLVDATVPANDLVEGPLEVEAAGMDAFFFRYEALRVERGIGTHFPVFMGTKPQPLLSLYGCNYAALGRAVSDEHRDEIESDFVAMLRSLP